jgi:phenylacetate-CoA ligase
MKKNGISIIVPCFNEEGNINIMYSKITNALSKIQVDYEIIFIDDKSTDHTNEEIKNLKNPHVRLVENNVNLGLYKSWVEGITEANFSLACLIDADGQNPPQEIVRLYEKLVNTGSDFVQGERSAIGRIKDNRYLLSKGLNLILKIIFKDPGKDIKSGYVLARTAALKDILVSMPKNINTAQSFIKLQAILLGYNVSTIETLFLNRLHGSSFIKKYPIKLVLQALVDIYKFYLFYSKNKKYSFFERYLNKHQPQTQPREFTIKETILMNLFFFTFPLHKWAVSKNVKKLYLALRKSQYWDEKTLIEYQNERLKHIFNHAYFNTKYYRNLFDSIGLNPGNFSGIDDLPRINTLTKNIVNENLYFDLFSVNHDKHRMYKISTSGSTGTPFSLFVDYFQLEMRMATLCGLGKMLDGDLAKNK